MKVCLKFKFLRIMELSKNMIFILLFLVSCNSSHSDSSTFLTVDIRTEMNNFAILELSDEIESVFYAPLEVTSDDASLIDGVFDYAVTENYIYVLPVKEPRIVLFDRQGHFLKTLIPEGQGPGEFSGLLTCIQADEQSNRLYLFSGDRIWVYTLDGEFIQQLTHAYQVIFERQIGKDRFAGIALPFMPFQGGSNTGIFTGGGSFGIGIFTENGDTIVTKNDFYSHLVPHEKTGLTVCMAAAYSKQQESVLFKIGSNDTVFRISDDKIQIACVLNLLNSDREVVRALDITDFTDLHGEQRDDKDIFVSDIFETPNRYYFRFRYNRGHCVASVDKNTGKTLVEKCEQPGTLTELAAINQQHGMLGTKSHQNFPIWGRIEGHELVQVVTPYELNLYKTKIHSISIPKSLNSSEEEGNPIFVFYKLKQQY